MDDLISRQAAIGIFTQLWDCIGTIMDRDEWEDVCKTTANELPSAQQWIPVTKRLPENDTIVLVTFSCGKVGTSSWHESTKFNNGFDNYMNGIYEDGTTEMYGVVAWMPLPEPYKAESVEV